MRSLMRSSKRVAKHRFARKKRKRSRTLTAPTAAPSRKAMEIARGSVVRVVVVQSQRRLQRDSRLAKKVKVVVKPKRRPLKTHQLTPRLRKFKFSLPAGRMRRRP